MNTKIRKLMTMNAWKIAAKTQICPANARRLKEHKSLAPATAHKINAYLKSELKELFVEDNGRYTVKI